MGSRVKSVVLLSGGLDSAVLLAHVRNTVGGFIHALSVDYGQRHRRELWSAFQLAHYYGATHEVVKVPPDVFAGSSLTGSDLPVSGAPTVVPGRNLVLVGLAVASAVRTGANKVWLAPTADDRHVYPDCRDTFVSHLSVATGAGYNVALDAPFLFWSKRDVVARGRELLVPFDVTWSCYDPQGYDPYHPASGVPCGKCGACVLRTEALKS